jgi:hypothetical protein
MGKNRINGTLGIGFFDVQVDHAGFAGLQSSLTRLKVPVYHFGVLIVRKQPTWIMQKRKANVENLQNV